MSLAATALQTERVPRVLIADDQTLFRSGLARLLQLDPRVQVVGEAADGMEAIKMVSSHKADIVLMDLKMPNTDGFEATRQILSEHPDVKILILTTFETDTYVLQALRSGASGYVLKDSEPDAIISSILAVRAGEQVMAGAVATRVLQMLTGATTPKELYGGLSSREVEILRLIAAGKANKQIAYLLKISEKTVRNHVSNMYKKLKIYDRTQAILYAIRKGLVEI